MNKKEELKYAYYCYCEGKVTGPFVSKEGALCRASAEAKKYKTVFMFKHVATVRPVLDPTFEVIDHE